MKNTKALGTFILICSLFLSVSCSKLGCAKAENEKPFDSEMQPGLTVTVGKKTYNFTDERSDEEKAVSYRVLTEWKTPPAAVVHRSYYEGGDILLLLESGQVELKGFPILSPNYKDMIVVAVDQSGGWNGIQAWEWTGDTFKQLYSYEPTAMEYYNYLAWDSPTKVRMEYTGMDDPAKPESLMCVPATLEKEASGWKLTKHLDRADKTQDCGIKPAEPQDDIPEEGEED